MLLVRHGVDERLPPDQNTGAPRHTMLPVYGEMMLQITVDGAGLPDVRTMTLSQIRFFYDGLRASLQRQTKPQSTPRIPRFRR